MLKISLLFKKNTNFTVNNSRILTIKNAKFSGYFVYMNLNTWKDFQICISVPSKKTLAQVFSCEFFEISKNTFLQNASGRLLIKGYDSSL